MRPCGRIAALGDWGNMQVLSDPKYRDYNLPALLEAAVRKFGEWSDAQLLHEQNAVTLTTPLYHYTGGEPEGHLKESASLVL
jgi:hypothetical protein